MRPGSRCRSGRPVWTGAFWSSPTRCAGLDVLGRLAGRLGGEVRVFGVRVDLLAGQEPNDRDACVARGAAAGRAGSRSDWRPRGRLPARYDSVVLSDLVIDLDVQIGIGAAAARHEPAHPLRPEDGCLGARDT